jgi:hypothetical protein
MMKSKQRQEIQARQIILDILEMDDLDSLRKIRNETAVRIRDLDGSKSRKQSAPKRSIRKTLWLIISVGMLSSFCLAVSIPVLGSVGLTGLMLLPVDVTSGPAYLLIVIGLLLVAGLVSLVWFLAKGMSRLYDMVISEER